ncbi:ABC transporter permease [Goodfellowiella coeruleoviolacea]|uniref:ABC-2 type transport system permease protein n=1 Tax=Goodfellowiella coeruleoviolacea TaxID=334858 RepID=A0AAE3KJ40_9PSEU|nr:ABC transporter permease [Goodfellowiella coeruleoviolacea]MCP2168034.1 ABC-2 type transport system permease protein [Goodfellowiella coeruleoviolacea]
MGNLIKSEFRKTLTTGLWWGLLIPTVLLSFVLALAFGAAGQSFLDFVSSDDLDELSELFGFDPGSWTLSAFALARAINVGTIFPMIFGGLAIAGEINRRTLTVTFLTAPNKVSALTAKMVVYVAWGAIYGLIIVAVSSLGVALTTDSAGLPDAGGWLGIAGTGLIASILVTMFGVGVGALLGSTVGTTLLLTLYMLLAENLLVLWLSTYMPYIGGFLPNGSASGLTGSIAASVFLENATGTVTSEMEYAVRVIAGAGTGALDWWASGLVFLGWTLLAFFGGWAVIQRKDIT